MSECQVEESLQIINQNGGAFMDAVDVKSSEELGPRVSATERAACRNSSNEP